MHVFQSKGLNFGSLLIILLMDSSWSSLNMPDRGRYWVRCFANLICLNGSYMQLNNDFQTKNTKKPPNSTPFIPPISPHLQSLQQLLLIKFSRNNNVSCPTKTSWRVAEITCMCHTNTTKKSRSGSSFFGTNSCFPSNSLRTPTKYRQVL